MLDASAGFEAVWKPHLSLNISVPSFSFSWAAEYWGRSSGSGFILYTYSTYIDRITHSAKTRRLDSATPRPGFVELLPRPARISRGSNVNVILLGNTSTRARTCALLFVSLFVYLTVCLFVCLFVCMPVALSSQVCIYLSTKLSIYLFIHVCQPVCPPACLSMSMYVYCTSTYVCNAMHCTAM